MQENGPTFNIDKNITTWFTIDATNLPRWPYRQNPVQKKSFADLPTLQSTVRRSKPKGYHDAPLGEVGNADVKGGAGGYKAP